LDRDPCTPRERRDEAVLGAKSLGDGRDDVSIGLHGAGAGAMFDRAAQEGDGHHRHGRGGRARQHRHGDPAEDPCRHVRWEQHERGETRERTPSTHEHEQR
jgi:hypothetical protein